MASKPTPTAPEPPATNVPLGRRNQVLSFERRTRLWLLGFTFTAVIPVAILLHQAFGASGTVGLLILVAMFYALAADVFFQQLIRPLQTLANIVAAIRDEDYSFRARGALRGDAIGDLALEINALSRTLQMQRTAAQDALSLLERVLTSMHAPVLAFDSDGRLRLHNPAALQLFSAANPIGIPASQLGLSGLLELEDQGLYPPVPESTLTRAPVRWSVRRATFRLHGVPHSLFVLSEIAAVLREEERLAWQKLIRVLSHEINNSLTPIKSIAGSLRAAPVPADEESRDDFARGLATIEDRAASLHRFLQAYQRLTQLPAPALQSTDVADLAARTASLETRLPVTLQPGSAAMLVCDADQVQQALINLLGNATDAALAAQPTRPEVCLSWQVDGTHLRFLIEDNGLGIDNPSNLFVPFYTTKPQGSGIGLALTQQIATAHGGTVTLGTHPRHRGSVATLTLPLTAPRERGADAER